MESFKKSLRLFGLVCLIVLGAIGVGISGGIPIPTSNRKKNPTEINITIDEQNEEGEEQEEAAFKL